MEQRAFGRYPLRVGCAANFRETVMTDHAQQLLSRQTNGELEMVRLGRQHATFTLQDKLRVGSAENIRTVALRGTGIGAFVALRS